MDERARSNIVLGTLKLLVGAHASQVIVADIFVLESVCHRHPSELSRSWCAGMQWHCLQQAVCEKLQDMRRDEPSLLGKRFSIPANLSASVIAGSEGSAGATTTGDMHLPAPMSSSSSLRVSSILDDCKLLSIAVYVHSSQDYGHSWARCPLILSSSEGAGRACNGVRSTTSLFNSLLLLPNHPVGVCEG